MGASTSSKEALRMQLPFTAQHSLRSSQCHRQLVCGAQVWRCIFSTVPSRETYCISQVARMKQHRSRTMKQSRRVSLGRTHRRPHLPTAPSCLGCAFRIRQSFVWLKIAALELKTVALFEEIAPLPVICLFFCVLKSFQRQQCHCFTVTLRTRELRRGA